MLIGPQGPPWWIFFQNFFKNVLVYPLPTHKYVLWHPKWEKSILGSRELKVKAVLAAFNQEEALALGDCINFAFPALVL